MMARAFKKLFCDRIKLATATAGKRGLPVDVILWASGLVKRRIAGEADAKEYGGGKYAGDNLADYVDFVGVCALGYAQGKYTGGDVHHMVIRWAPGAWIGAPTVDADSGWYAVVTYDRNGKPGAMEWLDTKREAQRMAKYYRSLTEKGQRRYKVVRVYSEEQIDAMGGIRGVDEVGKAAALGCTVEDLRWSDELWRYHQMYGG